MPSSTSTPSLRLYQSLIPGLPEDLGIFILALIPFSHQSALRGVCKRWREFFTSKTLLRYRTLYNSNCGFICIFPGDPYNIAPFLFNPKSRVSCLLPLLPPNPYPRRYDLRRFAAIVVKSHLYVIGGFCFDTEPMLYPEVSCLTFRFDAYRFSWETLAPMHWARGRFACSSTQDCKNIWVAGGIISRIPIGMNLKPCTNHVESYDITRNKWVTLPRLPNIRGGCVGFSFSVGKKNKFYVMGGYDDFQGHYYNNMLVKESDERWKQVGDSKRKLTDKAVLIGDKMYMIDENDIMKYDMNSNNWLEETHLPFVSPFQLDSPPVALDGKLYLISTWGARDLDRLDQLYFQIYDPVDKTWSFLNAKVPIHVDYKVAISCGIQL